MNEVLKQSIIDLLEAAKAHIEAGEHNLAVEKIDGALNGLANEGVDTADADTGAPAQPDGGEDGDGGKIKDPLPGTGTNGPM